MTDIAAPITSARNLSPYLCEGRFDAEIVLNELDSPPLLDLSSSLVCWNFNPSEQWGFDDVELDLDPDDQDNDQDYNDDDEDNEDNEDNEASDEDDDVDDGDYQPIGELCLTHLVSKDVLIQRNLLCQGDDLIVVRITLKTPDGLPTTRHTFLCTYSRRLPGLSGFQAGSTVSPNNRALQLTTELLLDVHEVNLWEIL